MWQGGNRDILKYPRAGSRSNTSRKAMKQALLFSCGIMRTMNINTPFSLTTSSFYTNSLLCTNSTATGTAEFIWWLIKAQATFLLYHHVILFILFRNSYEYSGFNMNFNEYNVCILFYIDVWGHWRGRVPKAKVGEDADKEEVNVN